MNDAVAYAVKMFAAGFVSGGLAIGGLIGLACHAAHADPTTCQYLGTNYPVKYDCLQNQPWLPYGTYDNPPNTGPYPGTNCALPMNQHNMGC